MSVRVVARIRPLLGTAELDKDKIVRAEPSGRDGEARSTVVSIPSPKNGGEDFKFTFNAVYDECSQEEIFTSEVAPNIKSLFGGLDLTIFAYGVTGTGKTHTMRGGTKLHDRGVIPRLLSGIYRRGRKVSKDSDGATVVTVTLSYYEIYNDKVFDLFGDPDKRPPAGLPLREKDGKTVVVGLSEWTCEDLKDFERLYVEANNNRSTAGTKLNAQSSRSHAILMVKLTQTSSTQTLVSTASAIDLAGSEDNRRTENGKERLVESASINKSLFVLSQCIDAIGRGDKRIPYRESKMTRILSLGQNNGITIMILNLAPLRSYHLDTLSSLNVSSRAKRIEVREIENEIVFTQPPRKTTSSIMGAHIQRQPLKPLTSNTQLQGAAQKAGDKPAKAFSVYSDARKSHEPRPPVPLNISARKPLGNKRMADGELSSRSLKLAKPPMPARPAMTEAAMSAKIEELVERKVSEIIANRGLDCPTTNVSDKSSEEVRRRLDELERRVENGSADPKAEGLRFIVMAKQHKQRGELSSALKMYEMALPFWPDMTKLLRKIEVLKAAIHAKTEKTSEQEERLFPGQRHREDEFEPVRSEEKQSRKDRKPVRQDPSDDEFCADQTFEEDDSAHYEVKKKNPRTKSTASRMMVQPPPRLDDPDVFDSTSPATPRTKRFLDIVNSRNLELIKGLSGLGRAKAKLIIDFLEVHDAHSPAENAQAPACFRSIDQVQRIPGLGSKTVEKAREGITC